MALLQEHRGHGVSTASYYLGRMLVAEGLHVLLVDLTGRGARLRGLLARGPVKNLVLWEPQLAKASDLGELLRRAREETAGTVDVLLLDMDASLFEHAGGLGTGIEYAVVVTAATLEGQNAADRIAERLGDAPPPYGRVGVVFSRVSATETDALKEQTENRKLPVIGHYPADYLLAAGDDYSVAGTAPSAPHEKYQAAIARLGRMLMRQVPLPRTTPVKAKADTGATLADAVPQSHPSGLGASGSGARRRPGVTDARMVRVSIAGEEPQASI
ncbi:MAG TPA: hypothetical protein VF120_01590 [Ktedonobacterales bacterium]